MGEGDPWQKVDSPVQTQLLHPLFVSGLLLLGIAGSQAEDNFVPLAQVPAAAQRTIRATVSNGALRHITRAAEEGAEIYEVEMVLRGLTRHFSVGADGKLRRFEVFLAETPQPVQGIIRSELGKGKLGEIERTIEDGEVIFDVDIIRNGKPRLLSVAASGQWHTLEVGLLETPPAVRRTIRQQLGGGKLGDITKSVEEEDVVYDAEMTRGNRQHTITVSPEGKVLRQEEEVSLAEAPEPVQRTIQSQVGGGKLLRLAKTTDDDGIAYEVEAAKDGKEFSFTVAADGRFLGADE